MVGCVWILCVQEISVIPCLCFKGGSVSEMWSISLQVLFAEKDEVHWEMFEKSTCPGLLEVLCDTASAASIPWAQFVQVVASMRRAQGLVGSALVPFCSVVLGQFICDWMVLERSSGGLCGEGRSTSLSCVKTDGNRTWAAQPGNRLTGLWLEMF